MSLIKSTPNNIYPPTIGNSLAVFVDINDGILKFKDQNGNTNTLSAYVNPSSESGVIMEGTGLGSTLRCGLNNNTIAPCSVVMGGELNKVGASGCYGTISGGFTNSAYGIGSSVSGGSFNVAGIGQGGSSCCDCCGVGLDIPIVEGIGISALIESCYSTIGGGCCNQSFGLASVVSGGANNMATSSYSSVGGGVCNSSYSAYSHIGGGQCNTICCMYGSILGGACNLVNHHFSSVVGCGITTTAECTFFANNICAITDMYVGGLTSGCAVCVGANGKLTNSAGGGGGVFALGSGVCSTQRSCVNNCSFGNYSGTLGGAFNSACGNYSSVINGSFNCTLGCYGIILNGCCNITNSSGYYTTILNGFCNVANGENNIILNGRCNTATTASCALVGTGRTNNASNHFTTVMNGCSNTASAYFGVILNGCINTNSSYESTILNGKFQTIAGGERNVILNGIGNTINTNSSISILGGGCNIICCASLATILNGVCNQIRETHCSTISGGYNNTLCKEGLAACGSGFAFIGQGSQNNITLSNSYCFNTILNGRQNKICGVGCFATILGNNHIMTASRSVIINGNSNSIEYGTDLSILGNGQINTICCTDFGVLMNGLQNTLSLSNGRYGFIGTGTLNQTLAECSTILNGSNNSISFNSNGSSILAGRCNTIAEQNGHIIGNTNIIPLGRSDVHILGSGIIADRCSTLFANNLSLKSLPTSSVGLPSGAVWNNGGVLNIV